ncbi:AHH domain-containing protein [Cystobacter fuscus]
MSLDEPANIVHLVGHQGPHPEEYHQEIYSRLNDAVSTCQTRTECKCKLVEALDEIAGDSCKPGSRLNKLLTKQP